MNKEEFLAAIAQRHRGLPREDIEASLAYYREMIDERVEDGMSEDEAVAAMGTPQEAAARILEETPLPKLVKARLKPPRTLQVWEIVLLVLGSPVWLPLVLVLFVLILILYLVMWILVLTLYVLEFSFGLSGVAAVIGSSVTILAGHAVAGIFAAGAGLIMAGLALLLFPACVKISAWVLAMGRLALRGLKRSFIRKGEEA